MSCVKISNTPKSVFAIKLVIPGIGVVHNSNAYLFEDIVYNRDVNKYSNVRIFAFHTNIRMRFLDSNIHIIFLSAILS